MSKDRKLYSLGALALASLLANVALAQESQQALPEIVVTESMDRGQLVELDAVGPRSPEPDAAGLLSRAPGGAFNNNGPLSGQSQYRGLFGPRMNVRVDGMYINSGGPNWMDPPLHYLPAGLIDELSLARGIANVGTGSGIGGFVTGRTKSAQFRDSGSMEMTGDATATFRSNDGTSLSAVLGAANQRHRVHVLGSTEQGDDLESGDGTIAATEHDRVVYGAGYGLRQGPHALYFQYHHTDTGPSGTPSLPLDIGFFDSDRFGVAYNGEVGAVRTEAGVYGSKIEHQMRNFELRMAPDFSTLPLAPFVDDDKRRVDAESDGAGFYTSFAFAAGNGELTLGIDGHFATHDAVVTDPDVPPFFVTNFNDAQRDELGAFVEWSRPLAADWQLDLGLRYQDVSMDADVVDALPAQLADSGMFGPGTPPFAVKVLRDRFNDADREQNDGNVDWTINATRQINNEWRVGFGVARKTRSPSYIERYLWAPLEVNAGLGDFNNYVGQIDLDPEVSHQLEFSVGWQGDDAYLLPQVFYRRVDDFIQGTAATDPIVIAVSGNANGDPTPLMFANVDAELYGVDVAFGTELAGPWRTAGTASWVRGKRRDIGDNLYRIAPANVRLSLIHTRGDWNFGAELLAFARGDKLSRTIVLDEPRSSNSKTPGYGIINLFGQWQSEKGLGVSLGVENLFDRQYINHLSGFNRIMGSSVSVGDRVPGVGISFFGKVEYRW